MSVNDYWEALRRAVQRTVDAGRIGRPAALRLTVHVGGEASAAGECRAALRAMAAGWFGSEPVGAHLVGGEGAPSVEALRWPGGQSALLAVSAGPGPVGGSLALMGSNGTLYHEIGGDSAAVAVALGAPEPAMCGAAGGGGGKARYGVVAVGGNRTHLEGYARTFAADPRCELKAVADQPGLPEYREGLNRLLAAELEVPYLPLEQALALDGVDIAINCADVERRGPVARAILEAGKHLYADKPLAGTREAAREIAAAAAAAGVTTQMFSQVWSDWGQRARAAIDQGVTGPVRALHCDMLMAKGKPGTAPPGARRERPGDGRFTFVAAKRELFDMGVYPIALVQWLSGRRVAEVYAMTGNYFFAEHAALDIEDYGALALRLDDGRVASICCGRIGATSHPRMGEQRITLIGERGIFTFSDASPRLEVYNDQPPFTAPPVHPFDPMQMWSSSQRDIQPAPKDRWVPLAAGAGDADACAFLDCIDHGRRPQVTIADAVHHVDVILAGYESAVSGKPVAVPR